jgi:hypothetical protein
LAPRRVWVRADEQLDRRKKEEVPSPWMHCSSEEDISSRYAVHEATHLHVAGKQ